MTVRPLDLLTLDTSNYYPDPALIGTRWKHAGNGHIYTITGYVWNGETDRWMIKHWRGETHPIEYCRTPQNFFGQRRNGEVRYIQQGD